SSGAPTGPRVTPVGQSERDGTSAGRALVQVGAEFGAAVPVFVVGGAVFVVLVKGLLALFQRLALGFVVRRKRVQMLGRLDGDAAEDLIAVEIGAQLGDGAGDGRQEGGGVVAAEIAAFAGAELGADFLEARQPLAGRAVGAVEQILDFRLA